MSISEEQIKKLENEINSRPRIGWEGRRQLLKHTIINRSLSENEKSMHQSGYEYEVNDNIQVVNYNHYYQNISTKDKVIGGYISCSDVQNFINYLSESSSRLYDQLPEPVLYLLDLFSWAHGRAMDARIIKCLEALENPPTVGDDTDGLTLRKVQRAIKALRRANLPGDQLFCAVTVNAWEELMRMEGFARAPSDKSDNFKEWRGITWIAHPALDDRAQSVGEGDDARAVANCYMYHRRAAAIAVDDGIAVTCSPADGGDVLCTATAHYGVGALEPRGIVRIPVRNDTI